MTFRRRALGGAFILMAGLSFASLSTPGAGAMELCEGCTDTAVQLLDDGPGFFLVPSTDTTDYAPQVDPLAVTKKFQLLASDEVTFDEQFATGINTPDPGFNQMPKAGDPDTNGTTPPPAMKLSISGVDQGNTNWCVPASVVTALSSIGQNRSLSNVAAALGQPNVADGARSLGPATDYLNGHQSHNYYYMARPGSPKLMLQYTQSTIFHGHIAVVGGYYLAEIPWWQNYVQNHPKAAANGHALTSFAYFTQNGGGFHVWDSADVSRHRIAASDAYGALAGSNFTW